jgi:hypothetical protein
MTQQRTLLIQNPIPPLGYPCPLLGRPSSKFPKKGSSASCRSSCSRPRALRESRSEAASGPRLMRPGPSGVGLPLFLRQFMMLATRFSCSLPGRWTWLWNVLWYLRIGNCLINSIHSLRCVHDNAFGVEKIKNKKIKFFANFYVILSPSGAGRKEHTSFVILRLYGEVLLSVAIYSMSPIARC